MLQLMLQRIERNLIMLAYISSVLSYFLHVNCFTQFNFELCVIKFIKICWVFFCVTLSALMVYDEVDGVWMYVCVCQCV